MKKSALSIDVVKKFEDVLRELIITKISEHWYPENPAKGQAYRSLSIDKKAHIDPLLSRAAASVGIEISSFLAYFTKVDSVLMWVDPDVVIVRIAYSGYTNVPPEDKILYRSTIGPSLKVVSSKPLKTATPPPIARPGILRTSPPGSPSTTSTNNNTSYLGSYRSSSPGLNSNAAQYFPSLHFTHPTNAPPSPGYPKPPAYIPAQRPTILYNNLFNQSQYITWQHSQYSENWNNDNNNQLTTQQQPQPPQPQQQPQQPNSQNGNRKLYIDYIDSVLPLEAQA